MLILAGVLAAVTVFDIVIHVAADQVEPLRIAGNVIVLAASVALFAVPRLRRARVAIAAGTGNLVLNGMFIAREGIGTLGWILVGTTTVLCVILAALPGRRGDALI